MARTILIVVVILLLPIIALALTSLLSRRPMNLGVTDGLLVGCPDTHNCVCSQDDGERHGIEPLPLGTAPTDAITRLKAAISSFPRTQIVEETDTYLRAEFTSALFRYVDDVEFLIDAESGVIQVRSASRAGHSDLGVNRSRVEAIRDRFSRSGIE